jgi:hypothetical protein
MRPTPKDIAQNIAQSGHTAAVARQLSWQMPICWSWSNNWLGWGRFVRAQLRQFKAINFERQRRLQLAPEVGSFGYFGINIFSINILLSKNWISVSSQFAKCNFKFCFCLMLFFWFSILWGRVARFLLVEYTKMGWKYTKLPHNIPNVHKVYQISANWTKCP